MASLTQAELNSLKDTIVVMVNERSRFGTLLSQEIADAGAEVIVLGSEHSTDSQSVTAGIQDIVAKHGRIDSFVYVLEEAAPDSLDTISNERWDCTRQLSRTMFWYYRAVGKQMAKQRQGSIIGVHFGVNTRGDAEMLSWAVLGEMLVGMSKCLAVELLKQNVRVNTVGYGYMDDVEYSDQAREVIDDYRKYLGIQRKGTARDVAGAVRLLASGAGSYITGQSVYINGGLII